VTPVALEASADHVLRDLTRDADEVSTNVFLRALVDELGITFEAARDEIYRLLETRRAELTSNYALRVL
jgi:hypothetical protein